MPKYTGDKNEKIYYGGRYSRKAEVFFIDSAFETDLDKAAYNQTVEM